MSEIQVSRPFVPDVTRCMVHFNAVMPMLVAGDESIADAYLVKVREDDGLEVYGVVMRMIGAACSE